MKGAEFRETLNSLGLTQAEASRLFGSILFVKQSLKF
jgi:hypothetical protein